MFWDDAQVHISRILGAFTIFFTLTIFLSSALLPQCRTQARSLVFYLSLCNFGQGLYFVIQNTSSAAPTFCIVESIFALFVDISSYMWSLCISYYVYRAMKEQNTDLAYLNKYFHALSWTWPLAIVIAVAAKQSEIMAQYEPFCMIQ